MRAIELLMEKQGKFDYILLETTGLADPGERLSVCVPSHCLPHLSHSYLPMI